MMKCNRHWNMLLCRNMRNFFVGTNRSSERSCCSQFGRTTGWRIDSKSKVTNALQNRSSSGTVMPTN